MEGIPIALATPLNVASLALELGEVTGLIPNPLDWLLGLLSGRPKMQATYDEAVIFMRRRSPALRLLGIGAGYLLERGIPISSPTAGPWFGPYYQAALVVENAIRWGVSGLNAKSRRWQRNHERDCVQRVDKTLTAAMHEAGNPGSGSATMNAIDAAWANLKSNAVTLLAQYGGGGLSGELVRAIGAQFSNPQPATSDESRKAERNLASASANRPEFAGAVKLLNGRVLVEP